MYYTPEKNLAFDSVERIMRDVNYGWLERYIHMVGASMFFILVYIHIFLRIIQGATRAAVDIRCRHSPADDGDRLHGLCPAWGK
jgi:hypothetical protein